MKILIFSFLFLPLTSFSKLFQSAHVSFELPEMWSCEREEYEFICHDRLQKDQKEAVIVFTTKHRSDNDNLDQYESYLKKPKELIINGKVNKSRPVKIGRRSLHKHVWIDASHESSEIPKFYTRYLATVKKNVAILVTFSSHKRKYNKYAADFLKAIKSLKVKSTQSEDLFKSISQGSGKLGKVSDENYGAYGDVDGIDLEGEEESSNTSFFSLLQNQDPVTYAGIGLILLSLIFLLFMIFRRKS